VQNITKLKKRPGPKKGIRALEWMNPKDSQNVIRMTYKVTFWVR
jgi:hypothetical protein